jgi:predicted O-methyltransferase YrrM
VLPDLPPVYDVVFIDGSHDYESVKRDADLALGRLTDNGVLAFHDYDSGRDEGVTRAVDELISGGATLLSRADSLAVLRPTLTPAGV